MRLDNDGMWLSAGELRVLRLTCGVAAVLAFAIVTVALRRYFDYSLSLAVGSLPFWLLMYLPLKIQKTRAGVTLRTGRFVLAAVVGAGVTGIVSKTVETIWP